jgi:hypothetical protein
VLNRSARSLFNQGTFTARREGRDAPIPDLPASPGMWTFDPKQSLVAGDRDGKNCPHRGHSRTRGRQIRAD